MNEFKEIPWRLDDLQGFSTNSGPTFDGGWFTGGGPVLKRSIIVRLLIPQGRPASVELDLIESDRHGCTVTLNPSNAHELARRLVIAAEMAHWQSVLNKQRAEMKEAAQRDLIGRAGGETT